LAVIARLLPFLLLLGCATLPGAPLPPITAEEKAAIDDMATSTIESLKAQKFEAATRYFDRKMKEALPSSKLAQTWKQIESQFGELESFELEDSNSKDGIERRFFLLSFERGRLQGVVPISRRTKEVVGLFFKPAALPKSPEPNPSAKPDSFTEEAAQVGEAPFVMGGTLLMPKGDGPFPAVVLVHGSGPLDRDGTVGANKPLKDIAEGLASRGIAVLRYDKRTFAHRERMQEEEPDIVSEVIEDAIHAGNVLALRQEIDRKRIYFVGHSLGALMAPEIALHFGTTAGVVMLAPSFRPLAKLAVAQMRYLGAPVSQIEELEKKADLIVAGKEDPDEEFLGVPASYWMDLQDRDAVGRARSLHKPILIMGGGRDYQVPPEEIDSWKRALETTPDVQVETYPALNHLFIAGKGKSGVAEYTIPGHVDVQVVEKIADFVNASGQAPAGGSAP